MFTVSIPQAVGAVATVKLAYGVQSSYAVSIPQAVGAVATIVHIRLCLVHILVSIPQAVGAVATPKIKAANNGIGLFQYRKR